MNLLRGLPALDAECAACVGVGMVLDPAWVSYYRGDSDIEPVVPQEIACDECAGTGRVVTEAGRELVAFLDTHLRFDAPVSLGQEVG